VQGRHRTVSSGGLVSRPMRIDRRTLRPMLALAAVLTVGSPLAACSTSGSDPVATEQDYLRDLEAICVETTAALDALPDPPAQITVRDFATDAASLLGAEADAARRLRAPGDLDADHRAFIRNTDEQSAAWRDVAASGSDDTDRFVSLTTRIAELVLGRNDLVGEMGAEQCRRGPV
jgi:hypothetical protein